MSEHGLRVLAVVAHPDDESFGLGAVIAWLRRHGASVALLVLTPGGASSLGRHGPSEALAARRRRELACASEVLGVEAWTVLDYPDGGLGDVRGGELVGRIAEAGPVDALLAFDRSGVTRHADHVAATAAAAAHASATGCGLYLWALPQRVAERLGEPFAGRPEAELDVRLDVSHDRGLQWAAVRCHQSQAKAFGVVRARLELLGDSEYLTVEQPVEGLQRWFRLPPRARR